MVVKSIQSPLYGQTGTWDSRGKSRLLRIIEAYFFTTCSDYPYCLTLCVILLRSDKVHVASGLVVLAQQPPLLGLLAAPALLLGLGAGGRHHEDDDDSRHSLTKGTSWAGPVPASPHVKSAQKHTPQTAEYAAFEDLSTFSMDSLTVASSSHISSSYYRIQAVMTPFWTIHNSCSMFSFSSTHLSTAGCFWLSTAHLTSHG